MKQRVHFMAQTGWPGDPLPPGYISPQSAIRHQKGQRSGDSSKQFVQREVHKGASQD